MKTALVISFFRSTNLGDIALSDAVRQITISRDYQLVAYDFSSGQKIQNSPISSLINSSNKVDTILKKNGISKVSRLLYRACERCFGSVNTALLKSVVVDYCCRDSVFESMFTDMLKADVIILAGGNMLMDIIPAWPVRVRKYIQMAKNANKPIYIIFVGVGPINSLGAKRIFRNTFRDIKAMSVRDIQSKALCNSFADFHKIKLTVDPVFAMKFSLRRIVKKDKYCIGICVLGVECFNTKESHVYYLKAINNLIYKINELSDRSVLFVLFSTERRDYFSVNKLVEMHNQETEQNCLLTIARIDTINDLLNIYSFLDYLIGGRMHAMIFAHKCLLPHIAVFWQAKIQAYTMLTENNKRLFSVSELHEDARQIAKLIFAEIYNTKCTIKMVKINNRLSALAQDGFVITEQ